MSAFWRDAFTNQICHLLRTLLLFNIAPAKHNFIDFISVCSRFEMARDVETSGWIIVELVLRHVTY